MLRELTALLTSCDHVGAQRTALALSQRLRAPPTVLTLTNQLQRATAIITEPSGCEQIGLLAVTILKDANIILGSVSSASS